MEAISNFIGDNIVIILLLLTVVINSFIMLGLIGGLIKVEQKTIQISNSLQSLEANLMHSFIALEQMNKVAKAMGPQLHSFNPPGTDQSIPPV